jgi:transposase-like protein
VALWAQLSHLRPEVSRLGRARYRRQTNPPSGDELATSGAFGLPATRPPLQRVTADLLSYLITGYKAGQTTYQLARTHGLNRNTVAMHLRTAGVTIRMDGMTPEQIEQAVEYYRAGWSLAKIGREVGADAETVRKRLCERGVPMRSFSRMR